MATIAAFIGAGGYGERIVTGLALNDHGMLLAGVGACWLQAVPLASSSKKQVTVRSLVIRSP